MAKFEIIEDRWIRFTSQESNTSKTETYDLRRIRKFTSGSYKVSVDHFDGEIYMHISRWAAKNIKYGSKEEEQYNSDLALLEGILFGRRPA